MAIGTLRVHLRAVYDKLHVHSRTEAGEVSLASVIAAETTSMK